MTIRPILFSAPMVRALLEGRKTQTRRILKCEVPEPPRLDNVVHFPPRHGRPYLDAYNKTNWWCWWTRDDRPCEQFDVKFAPGDVLWVRESCYIEPGTTAESWDRDLADVVYRADGGSLGNGPDDWASWRPSIHMPRWASRLTLAVTGVKVERLQDISKADVLAEGISERDGDPITDVHCGWHEPYAALWDEINGPGAWAANPWVVAVTFTVHQQNVDAFLAQKEAA